MFALEFPCIPNHHHYQYLNTINIIFIIVDTITLSFSKDLWENQYETNRKTVFFFKFIY